MADEKDSWKDDGVEDVNPVGEAGGDKTEKLKAFVEFGLEKGPIAPSRGGKTDLHTEVPRGFLGGQEWDVVHAGLMMGCVQ